MAANTHSVKCPELVCAGCGGQTVTAHYGATAVTVDACQPLLAQGWAGPAVVLWHSQALELLVPAATAAPVQHAAGLVVFA